MDTDPLDILDSILPLREVLRGVVAAFEEDGFTNEQAHAIAFNMYIDSVDASEADEE